jgi:DNA-binding transcriptional LysR family regulator
MLDRAGKMEVFVEVVNAGSISAAARKLQLTPSAVSKLLSRIEEDLGVRLIDRSTKSLKLTPEGELYYHRSVRIISDIEETIQEVSEGRSLPRGRLRINCSVPIGVRHIQPLIPEYLQRYPEMNIDLSLTDTLVDLLEERVDVAIRIGPIQDSSLKARKLCDSRRVIAASPEYLRRCGIPLLPADLSQHNCLNFNMRPLLNEWPFVQDGAPVSVPIRGSISANNGESLRQFILSGAGIARLAWFQIGHDIVERRLVPLLEPFHPNDQQGVYAIFFGHKYTSARVRTFIDFLAEKFSAERPFLGADLRRRALVLDAACQHGTPDAHRTGKGETPTR